ncbi:MAG: hypothetical protein Q8P32_00130 [Candidatus Komeilibacteria bacterium]|nr:hypothetical protein [Candidatus Komeilibacteria bacterium]
MRKSAYLAAVDQIKKMDPFQGGEIGSEEKCRRALREAISLNDELFQMKEGTNDPDETDFLDRELEKIESAQFVLRQRLTQAGSMISDERVAEAFNQIEAVRQALPTLTSD